LGRLILEKGDIKTRIGEVFNGEVMYDEPMAYHTTLRIGGPVDVMVFPDGIRSLKALLELSTVEGIPVWVIGNGSNLLVNDRGLRGMAISLKLFRDIRFIKKTEDGDIILSVDAGVSLGNLITYTKRHGYSGMEPLVGIPGTFGGAVYTNAGSFGREIKDLIVSVTVIDRRGEIKTLHQREIGFSYRSSNLPSDLIILNACIRLTHGDEGIISREINRFLQIKRTTQPISERSAGCVFKNPQGYPAGRLIDEAGCKGMRVGDVEVSSIHANYFINKGNATFRDFMKLMTDVMERVKRHSGVILEPEINIAGDD